MANPRKEILVTGETYHIFNRSVANEEIFADIKLLNHILDLTDYYRYPQTFRFSKFKTLPFDKREIFWKEVIKQTPIIDIYSFAFMPNHFHFLVKQNRDGGIKIFISNLQNGFAKYYNLRNEREGSLFQSPFKSKRITTEEEFIHVSRYIHLNPVTSYLIEFEQLKKYPFTSYLIYIGRDDQKFINKEPIEKIFRSTEKYDEFVRNQVDYQRSLNKIKNLLLEKYKT